MMVKWYNRDELAKAVPNKKDQLLTRYHETCNHGEQTAPTLPSALVSEDPRLEAFPALDDEDGEPSLLEAFPSQ